MNKCNRILKTQTVIWPRLLTPAAKGGWAWPECNTALRAWWDWQSGATAGQGSLWTSRCGSSPSEPQEICQTDWGKTEENDSFVKNPLLRFYHDTVKISDITLMDMSHNDYMCRFSAFIKIIKNNRKKCKTEMIWEGKIRLSPNQKAPC